ncbi:MAG: PAS domain S-box-containing protein, partial [Gammaproteobacteria bacterium]
MISSGNDENKQHLANKRFVVLLRWWVGRCSHYLYWIVLAGSLGITYQIYQWEESQIRNEWQIRFEAQARKVPDLITARMEVNLQMLRGVAGLFAASVNVDRAEFKIYAEAVMLKNPGLLGLSFSQIVTNVGKDKYTAAVQRTDFLDFHIHPEGTRDFYTPVLYIEPLNDANLRALGYDLYSNSVRRKALDSARDSGKGTITSKILLVQDGNKSSEAGALLVYPVYNKGVPIDTLDARRSNINGWVTAPFHLVNLMSNLLVEIGSDIDIEVYDGDNIGVDTLIYTDHAPDYDPVEDIGGFQNIQRVEVGGRTWIIKTSSGSSFIESQGGYGHLGKLVVFALVCSLMLSFLFFLLSMGRERAIHKALELASDLDDSIYAESDKISQLQAILDTAMDAIITIDANGYITSFNKSATRIFGYMIEEVMGKNVNMLMPQPYQREHVGYINRYLSDGVSTIIGQNKSVELVGMRKDGSTFEIEVTLNERKFSNEVSFTGVLRDISDRKRIEKELNRQKQQSDFKFDNDIARIINAMAQGDLTQKVVLGEAGETPRQREIFENINTMVDQINRFSSEVTRVAREVGTEGILGGQAEVPGVAGTWQELTENV